MRIKFIAQAVVLALLTAVLPASLAGPIQGKTSAPRPADPISGNWSASFEFDGGRSFTRTLDLKLQGKKVSGTAGSSQAGADPIIGTWEAGELNIVIEGERGTMALTGRLTEGRLAGVWDVGHAKGKWEAKRK